MAGYENFVKRMASKIYEHDKFTPSAIHGVMGVSTEAAELLDLVRKGIFYGKDVRPDQILDEAGDVLWFLALTLQQYGYTIEDAKAFNVTKLETRHGKEFNQDAVIKTQVRERTVWHGSNDWRTHEYCEGPVPDGAYERMVRQD